MEGASLMKAIQIKNFRSLKDTGTQVLSPITVLVGQNSSGKSTFLRAFPLLKQSISKRTEGPILWAGDVDDYVDFGSFEETVTNDNSSNISFTFSFPLQQRSSGYYGLYSTRQFASERENFLHNISYKITITPSEGREMVSSLILNITNTCFYFDLDKRSVCINDTTALFESKKKLNADQIGKNVRSNRTLFGRRSVFEFILPDFSDRWEELLNFLGFDEANRDQFDSIILNDVIAYIGDHLCRGISFEDLFDNINIKSKRKKSYFETELFSVVNLLKEKMTDASIEKLQRIVSIIMLSYAYSFFSEIDDYISRYFKQVHYIAPVRATAERYYRLRNLAVNEVDYQGKNLAVFINSLSKKELEQFGEWTNELFGFAIEKNKSKGHISLLIRLKGSEAAINLSDTGFGYSQILPIITQIWELSTRKKEGNAIVPLVIAIEQPELHLHPAVQAKLAKAFISSIKLARDNGYQLQLLLETHSTTIVNYFGKAIAKNELSPKEVSVILFDKKESENVTLVKTSTYDEDGFLQNWPFGFFEPEE